MDKDQIYLSTFMPIIERAETHIKKLIFFYAMNNKPKKELQLKIEGVIDAVDERLPKNVINRQDYITGLKEFAKREIKKTYDTIVKKFIAMLLLLSMLGLKPQKSPIEMVKYTSKANITKEINEGVKTLKKSELKQLSDLDLWAKAKGTPYVPNYDREIKKRIEEMVKSNVTSPNGISLWQKAEIDIRHEHQMQMINEVKSQGRYAYISSHPDCSKRCSKWQGKLMDLNATQSELTGFRMKKKIDGHQVYCFNEIIHQKQKMKNGKEYENNVIVGFNCRHHLIPYNGQLPPEEYNEKDIKKEREINAKLRAMEREIRRLKQKYALEPSKALLQQIKKLYNNYVNLAEKYGFPHLKWRTNI